MYCLLYQETEDVLHADVDMLMSTDNETGKMSTKDVTFSRAHTGFIFKADKKVCSTLAPSLSTTEQVWFMLIYFRRRWSEGMTQTSTMYAV